MGKVVIPFEADTSKVDAALDAIEQRVERIVAKFAGVRIAATDSDRAEAPRPTDPAPQAQSFQPQKQQQGGLDALLKDVVDELKTLNQTAVNIEEGVAGVSKP